MLLWFVAAFESPGSEMPAASRAYVPASIWPQVKERMLEETAKLKMGDPRDFTNFMCAVIDGASFKKISEYIDYANVSKDAEVLVRRLRRLQGLPNQP